MRRKCLICEEPIPAARIEFRPQVKTCGKVCAAKHATNVRRKTSREAKRRRRAEIQSRKRRVSGI